MPSASCLDNPLEATFLKPLEDICCSTCSKIIVAVSGGSDSLAMAVILKHYLATNHPKIKLVAITIDHGLRAESAEEAMAVRKMCQRIEIDHEIVRWEGEKPTSGIQRLAREARYALLGKAAKRHGTNLVFTGHTLDDHLETIAMRAARASSGRPVLGISRFTLFKSEIWFARPLLGFRKQILRELLMQLNHEWIEDPSNKDTKFERVRVRLNYDTSEFLAVPPPEVNFFNEPVCALLSDEHLIDFSKWDSSVRMRRACFDHAGFLETLRVLLSLVGQTSYLPTINADGTCNTVRSEVEAIFTRAANKTKYTIGRCLMVADDAYVNICREYRNVGHGTFGFDFILPDHNYDIAQALRRRRGLPELPPIPIKLATY